MLLSEGVAHPMRNVAELALMALEVGLQTTTALHGGLRW
jgi:hypothetical protein